MSCIVHINGRDSTWLSYWTKHYLYIQASYYNTNMQSLNISKWFKLLQVILSQSEPPVSSHITQQMMSLPQPQIPINIPALNSPGWDTTYAQVAWWLRMIWGWFINFYIFQLIWIFSISLNPFRSTWIFSN